MAVVGAPGVSASWWAGDGSGRLCAGGVWVGIAPRRFCTWPKLYLQEPPRINLPGMHLGYMIASPLGFRCKELAQKLTEFYGFDVVDIKASMGGSHLGARIGGSRSNTPSKFTTRISQNATFVQNPALSAHCREDC